MCVAAQHSRIHLELYVWYCNWTHLIMLCVMTCTECTALVDWASKNTIYITMQRLRKYTITNKKLQLYVDLILMVVYKVLFLRDTWSKTTSYALAVTSCVNSECCSVCVLELVYKHVRDKTGGRGLSPMLRHRWKCCANTAKSLWQCA